MADLRRGDDALLPLHNIVSKMAPGPALTGPHTALICQETPHTAHK